MNEPFNSEAARASCNCDSLQLLPATVVSVAPVARERKSRVRGRPPDSQPERQYADLVPMRQAHPKLEKQTAGNGSSTEPKVLATLIASVLDCMGSDHGRYPVAMTLTLLLCALL